jgi:hypothetical protein
MSNVKNVQSLEQLLGICTGLGGSYNPGNQNLQVKAMTTLLSQARNVLSEVHYARTGYEIATNQREDAFSTLKPLTTRIISTLLSGGAMPQTVADARTMSRKIFGTRISQDRAPLPAEGVETPKTKRRARGLDYESLTSHFAKLLETVAASPRYKTNEQDLSVDALKKQLTALQKHNSSVIEATVTWKNARIKRNEVLYTLDRNLYDSGQRAKQYVKSAFGNQSEVYRAASKIRFTKPQM